MENFFDTYGSGENFELCNRATLEALTAVKCGSPDYPTMQHNAIGSYRSASTFHGSNDPKSIFYKVAAQTLRACQINALRMGDY